eukprot:20440-Pleurochrysis_carterae.AAC.2
MRAGSGRKALGAAETAEQFTSVRGACLAGNRSSKYKVEGGIRKEGGDIREELKGSRDAAWRMGDDGGVLDERVRRAARRLSRTVYSPT